MRLSRGHHLPRHPRRRRRRRAVRLAGARAGGPLARRRRPAGSTPSSCPGFSYGDYLGRAIAASRPIMGEVVDAAAAARPSASATASSAVRGRPAPGRADPQRRAALRLSGSVAEGRVRRHRLDGVVRRRAGDPRAAQVRRGAWEHGRGEPGEAGWRRRPRSAGRARGRAPAAADRRDRRSRAPGASSIAGAMASDVPTMQPTMISKPGAPAASASASASVRPPVLSSLMLTAS